MKRLRKLVVALALWSGAALAACPEGTTWFYPGDCMAVDQDNHVVTVGHWRPGDEEWQSCAVAQAADAATTVIGLAAGLSEANPLGPAVLVGKMIYLAWTYQHRAEIGAGGWTACKVVGWGSAIWNVGVLVR